MSDNEDLNNIGEQAAPPLEVEVGDSGLFSFLVKKNRLIMPGKWFHQSSDQLESVEEFIARFAADSTGVVREFKAKYPNVRLRLEVPE